MGKDKKVWSQLQDQLLKKFYEEDQIRNWTLIAKKMMDEYNTPKKSGKQCRQRYENHIDTSVVKIEWTREEEQQLIRLHNQIGNKWANIALYLPGKSDNCVKNHFYSKLRKVLRKLNKIIHRYLRREFRQINITVIYKLVQATEQRFKQKPNCSQQVSIKCRDIQNRMLDVVLENEEDEEEESLESVEFYKEIIKEIYVASKEYKRKSKKSRNMSIQAPNFKKKSKLELQQKSAKAALQDGYMSSDSSNQDGEFSLQDEENFHKTIHPPHSFIVNEQQKPSLAEKKIEVEEGKERIENLLRENNILENEFSCQGYSINNNNFNINNNNNNNYFKFSDKSSFKSFNNSDRQSDRDFFNVFESSDREGGNRNISNYIYFCQRLDDNKNLYYSEKQ